MKLLKTIALILLLSITIVLISCDKNRVFEKYMEIPDYKWNRKHVVKFKVNITDTSELHNVYINIRNSGKYTKANLWLFIRTISPQGKEVRDTFQCLLADKTGRWLGSGLGDIFDSQFLFKQEIAFSEQGNYIFEYEQAMREEVISGIMDVGIRVEKTKN